MSAAVRSAAPPERERLVTDFVRLCEIESPSRRERAVADAVTAELEALGLAVEEDSTGADTGSDAGNLLARIAGPEGARTILLCAHLDTVPLAAPVRVVQEGGALRNRNEAIVGADNKAAVVTILGAARRLVGEGSPVGVELLFTTCEEQALDGAKAFSADALRSEYGFVFDHASPIGEIVVASPTYYRLEARFLGHAAHAGIRPEAGHNAIVAAARAIAAMPNGRLDPETTANAGLIEGGSAANVVAERCVVELETRSLDEARAAEVVQTMVDTATEAAGEVECDVETEVERLFRGYRLPRTAPAVEVAAEALRRCGVEPSYIVTGGGSDANALIAGGLPVVNVANGTERNHQPDESVTVAALEQMLDVTLAIVAASAG
ncbi:MAG TPA: M20/M25/M40 family metallo-hydrolase [Thermoleophilaceae bacterium]|nr:M20/M25/M40 family metallo-hydrolase [Thermoleophilaceae bacterium]